MATKPKLGSNNYSELLRRCRSNNQVIRDALRRIVDEVPGPQTLAMLITKIAVAVGNNEAVISELDEIGRTAKNFQKGD